MPRSERLPQVKEVFSNETDLLKITDHPNILKLLSFDDNAKAVDQHMNIIPIFTLELEYAEHGELFDVIHSSGTLSEKEARFYFKQLISALEHVHSHGFAHRDIKAENLLLDSDYNLKLADFGFSSKAEKSTERSGTIGYMAPEVDNCQVHDGKVSDIYSCAIVLFLMVFGYLPYTKKHQIKDDIIDETSELFMDLFFKMTNTDPQKRITIVQIKEHGWWNEPSATLEDIQDTFPLRCKISEGLRIKENIKPVGGNLHSHMMVPNDTELQTKLSGFKKKGLKQRKFSEFFSYTSQLESMISKFASENDLSYTQEDNESPIQLDSSDDESDLSMKVNIIKSPERKMYRLECIR